MLEPQRQSYLSSLGIDSWFPRVDIPGARPSPIISDEEFLEFDGSAEVEELASVEKSANDKETVAASISPEGFSSREPLNSAPVDVSEELDHRVSQSVNEIPDIASPFALKFEVLNDGTLLVAELRDSLAPDYSAMEHRLKNDILFFLGLENVKARDFLFYWPIVKNSKLNQSRQDVSQALAGIIDARFGVQSRFERVILLGSNAAEFMLERHDKFELREKMIVSYRLADMLDQPLLKKHLFSKINSPINNSLTNSDEAGSSMEINGPGELS